MFEIKGEYSAALCYAKVTEDEAIEQIRQMCNCSFTEGSRIRIMPDVHAGKGCTIGTTMTVHGKAVPNVVGVDIGCGMYTVDIGRASVDLVRLDAAAHEIPSSMNVWESVQEPFDLTELICYPVLKYRERLAMSLGTLGGGNHFIEVDRAADGTQYLVVHSGSRNLGKRVANHYQKLAVEQCKSKKPDPSKRNALIAEYKSAGREAELQQALKTLSRAAEASDLPDELCFVSDEYFTDYLHDVAICQRFAKRNREKIAEILLARSGLPDGEAFHTVHNYIDTDEMILRKGAIAAHAGEKVLIPINMRDGSVLAIGKGNAEWNYSAPHGAGRILSRSKALKQLDMEEYRREMAGVYTTSVNEATLDESPMAYKSLSDILDVIQDSVEVVDVMKPVYNFKAN